MTDRWDELKAWLEDERDAAGEASRDAADAVTAAAAASTREFDAAIQAACEVNGRCAALREVAQQMAELERRKPRPRLRGPGGEGL
jgi:hypothetical protein